MREKNVTFKLIRIQELLLQLSYIVINLLKFNLLTITFNLMTHISKYLR